MTELMKRKDAEKITEQKRDKYYQQFDKEVPAIDKYLDGIFQKPLLESYLQVVIEDNIDRGIAKYSLDDFTKRGNKPIDINSLANFLKEQYPAITKLNDPKNIIKRHFNFACFYILKEYGYDTDSYRKEFSWRSERPDDSSLLGNFKAKMADRAWQKSREKSYFAEKERQQAEEEETAKMTKFAKILAKELKKQK